MTIPQIIHLVEPEHNVLSVWQNLHPDWQCIEWSIEGCYAFLKRYYPEAEDTFLQYTDEQQRIHMAWYYLLDRYGGVAVEGNRIPKRKIDSLFLSVYDLYVIEDWFIASSPSTDFLKSAREILPQLKAGWVERMLGGRGLVKMTAVVEPSGPFKQIPKRIYSSYFHPVTEVQRVSKLKTVLVIVCVLMGMAVYNVWKNLDLWKIRWKILFPPKRVMVQPPVPTESVSVPSVPSALSVPEVERKLDVLPEFTTLKSISLESLEKNLNLPPLPPPPIRIPAPSLPPSLSRALSPLSTTTLELSPMSSLSSLSVTPMSVFSPLSMGGGKRSVMASPLSSASDELVIMI